MGACFQAPHATPGYKPMEAQPFCYVMVHMTLLIKTTQRDY